MLWGPLAAAGVSAFMDSQRRRQQERWAEEAARREDARQRQSTAAGILASNAGSLGAPTYNVQAAQTLANERARAQERNIQRQQEATMRRGQLLEGLGRFGAQQLAAPSAPTGPTMAQQNAGTQYGYPGMYDDEDPYGGY